MTAWCRGLAWPSTCTSRLSDLPVVAYSVRFCWSSLSKHWYGDSRRSKSDRLLAVRLMRFTTAAVAAAAVVAVITTVPPAFVPTPRHKYAATQRK